ncbi:hypothetical protein SAMN04487939_10646 [Lysobacter sp. yr284]|uniref:hypothetical protein n=1 Tax=Lysobacter TaxID=68 RepID=UPI000898E256|nr:hypothetical protein [Lysobacter sp. yr284]SDY78050.1 hypothetical protein SAMN04487939_10646 [Lysobacter sp. yr284]
MGNERPAVIKTVLQKGSAIPASEALRANSASAAEFKAAMIELNAPTSHERAFLDEFAK